MSSEAISVRNLSKMFKVYNKPSDLFWELITGKQLYKEFWALKDVSFDMAKGEVVGIIGRNGAGKSTLLKIIAGTLNKTSGIIKINGKVSAILELGSGFNPEHSGRENIYIGGMCIGMKREEIDSKIDSIIKFSELESVIDQPYRTYSSGMQGRLTFSLCISMQPDIFIVDEALAVGDALFVSKCLKRIGQLCDSGATILFVSHGIDLVKRLCKKVIYMEKGKIIHYADAKDVCSIYESLQLELSTSTYKSLSETSGVKIMNKDMLIKHIDILNGKGEVCNAFYQHSKVTISISVICSEPITNPALWIRFTRIDGVVVTSWLSHEPEFVDIGILEKGEHLVNISIDDLMIGDGVFYLTIAFFPYKKKSESFIYLDPICMWDKVIYIEIKRKGRPLQTYGHISISLNVLFLTIQRNL